MDRLRILNLNIWNRKGPWETRITRIREGITRLSPDVVGLEEVLFDGDKTQADEIREGLGYEAAFGMAHDLGGGAHFGNAVLSRFPIEHRAVFPLPTAGDDERRALLATSILTPFGRLPFFVTHLNWKNHDGVAREAQVVAIADHVWRLAPVARAGVGMDLPAVLVGDFNAMPESAEIRFLKGLQSLDGKSVHLHRLPRGRRARGRATRSIRRQTPSRARRTSYPRRIDYVFVRGPELGTGRGMPLSCEVVFTEGEDGVIGVGSLRRARRRSASLPRSRARFEVPSAHVEPPETRRRRRRLERPRPRRRHAARAGSRASPPKGAASSAASSSRKTRRAA